MNPTEKSVNITKKKLLSLFQQMTSVDSTVFFLRVELLSCCETSFENVHFCREILGNWKSFLDQVMPLIILIFVVILYNMHIVYS